MLTAGTSASSATTRCARTVSTPRGSSPGNHQVNLKWSSYWINWSDNLWQKIWITGYKSFINLLMKQIQRLYANSDRKYFEVFKFKTQKTFSSMFTYLNCAYCVGIVTWTLGLSSSSSRRTSSQALHPANIQNLRSAGFAHFIIEGHQLKNLTSIK